MSLIKDFTVRRRARNGGSHMRNISLSVVALTIVAGLVSHVSMTAQSQSESHSSVQPEVQYGPGPALKANAAAPAPTAKQRAKKGSIGEGKVIITTADSDNDFWVDEIDLEGKGQKTDAQMLWDDADKVLYTFADKTIMCKDGSSADISLLISVYGTGNTAKRPVGSGWWIANLDEGKCGMKTEGLYGCKFDQNGNNTACGIADLDKTTHDLTIVEPTSSR
jgi:hypothetical protein